MTGSLVDRIKSHFDDLPDGELLIPEWEETVYWNPLTVHERRKIYAAPKNGGELHGTTILIRAIILKALNESGKRLFSEMDEKHLLHHADPSVVATVGDAILGLGGPKVDPDEVMGELGND